MANSNTAGYGLIPVSTLGNTPSTQGQSSYKIAAAVGTSIFNGAPVKSAAGYVVEGTNVTTGTNSQMGVLNGIFYNASTTLKPTWANAYIATITPANSEDTTAFVLDNPWQNYQIATDAALPQSGHMETYNLNAAAGTDTTGKSSNTLDIGSTNATTYSWRVLRIAEDPANSDITAAYLNVVIVANLNEFKDSA
jgi:hypothetical protein|tara:strand:- start:14 stop:595 length:582 start_codon:yes stop_codon:yes gene_type:complete